MKTAIIFLFAQGFFFNCNSQNVIQLEETKLKYVPKVVMVKSGSGEPVLKVRELYAGQFSENPIKFIKENFDLKALAKETQNEKFDTYYVTFKSKKGSLTAVYNKEGELELTSQKFQNVLLPIEMRKGLLQNYKGWSMTKNSYFAWGKKDQVDQEVYKISLRNGKERKNIKITPAPAVKATVASIK